MFNFFIVVLCVFSWPWKSLATADTIQVCESSICLNGGSCVNNNINNTIPDSRNWACQCPNTHFGEFCQNENVCLSHPEVWCVNGTCTDVSGSDFNCVCDHGYKGPRCNNYDPCVSDPCENGNTCEYILNNRYRCKCNTPGYYGQFCDMYNNCTVNPCNKGVCEHVGDKEFLCHCNTENTGYYGDVCEFHNPCFNTDPCQNNGTCIYNEEGETVQCECLVGYGGSLCQFVDLCDMERPCLNQGVCTPFIKEPPEYECHCQKGYFGENCQIAVRCPADITVDIRGFIQWPTTLVHREIDMPCQFGGMARRKCVPNDKYLDRPRWKYPDTSTCEPVNITRALAKEFTAYLKNITRNAFDMIEEELESSTELLLAVAKYTYDDVHFAKDVVDCISNLLFVNKSTMRSSSNEHGTNIQLLHLLEKYQNEAEIDDESVSLSLNREHVKIYIKETRFQDVTKGIDYTCDNASIYVPGEALLSPDGEKRRRVGFIQLNKNTFFIENLNFTENNTTVVTTKWRECSEDLVAERGVISADVVENSVEDLNNPVVVNFKIPEETCPFTCAFWNESGELRKISDHTIHTVGCTWMEIAFQRDLLTQAQRWDTNGIVKRSQNESYVSCESDHLTYFSIILDPHYSPAPPAKHQKILSIISYVGCSITILSLILTIFTYVIFKLLRTISGKILINLCMSLLGVNVMFMLQAIPSAVKNTNICRSLAICLHYFTLSTFLWMGTEAVHMHQTLIKVFRSGRTNRFMAKCMIVSWGIPFIPVAIVLSIDITLYTAEAGCMLGKDNELVYYLSYMGPCLLILAANFVIFFMVLHAICACRRKHTVHTKSGIRRTQVGCAISVTFLLGLTWVFSLLKIGAASLAFHYIFTIVNSLLGFFIFLFRCALNPEALRNWKVFCITCSKEVFSGTSADGSNSPNTATTNKTKKLTGNDSGNYTEDYAQINPNFFADTNKGNNTVLLSVVSQSSKHFHAIDSGSIKLNNITLREESQENNYEYVT